VGLRRGVVGGGWHQGSNAVPGDTTAWMQCACGVIVEAKSQQYSFTVLTDKR